MTMTEKVGKGSPWLSPRNAQEVRGFLELVPQNRKFVVDFADTVVAARHQLLTKPGIWMNQWVWPGLQKIRNGIDCTTAMVSLNANTSTAGDTQDQWTFVWCNSILSFLSSLFYRQTQVQFVSLSGLLLSRHTASKTDSRITKECSIGTKVI